MSTIFAYPVFRSMSEPLFFEDETDAFMFRAELIREAKPYPFIWAHAFPTRKEIEIRGDKFYYEGKEVAYTVKITTEDRKKRREAFLLAKEVLSKLSKKETDSLDFYNETLYP